MSAALVLRGYAHRHLGRTRHFGIDWRRCVSSHHDKLITPLRDHYGRCDVILCTYEVEKPIVAELSRDYRPDIFVQVRDGGTQRGTALVALDQVILAQEAIGTYDLVVMTRFDLEFLMRPWELESYGTFKPDCINFLWREWNEKSWLDHRRVPDAVHMLPGSLLTQFRRGVAETPSDTCLHLIYHPVARLVGEGRMNVLNNDGYCDSNTDVMPNPVYKMVRIT